MPAKAGNHCFRLGLAERRRDRYRSLTLLARNLRLPMQRLPEGHEPLKFTIDQKHNGTP